MKVKLRTGLEPPAKGNVCKSQVSKFLVFVAKSRHLATFEGWQSCHCLQLCFNATIPQAIHCIWRLLIATEQESSRVYFVGRKSLMIVASNSWNAPVYSNRVHVWKSGLLQIYYVLHSWLGFGLKFRVTYRVVDGQGCASLRNESLFLVPMFRPIQNIWSIMPHFRQQIQVGVFPVLKWKRTQRAVQNAG